MYRGYKLVGFFHICYGGILKYIAYQSKNCETLSVTTEPMMVLLQGLDIQKTILKVCERKIRVFIRPWTYHNGPFKSQHERLSTFMSDEWRWDMFHLLASDLCSNLELKDMLGFFLGIMVKQMGAWCMVSFAGLFRRWGLSKEKWRTQQEAGLSIWFQLRRLGIWNRSTMRQPDMRLFSSFSNDLPVLFVFSSMLVREQISWEEFIRRVCVLYVYSWTTAKISSRSI